MRTQNQYSCMSLILRDKGAPKKGVIKAIEEFFLRVLKFWNAQPRQVAKKCNFKVFGENRSSQASDFSAVHVLSTASFKGTMSFRSGGGLHAG